MTDDIVTRLEGPGPQFIEDVQPLRMEAADRIKELEKRIEALDLHQKMFIDEGNGRLKKIDNLEAELERKNKWLDTLLNTHKIEEMQAVVDAAKSPSKACGQDGKPMFHDLRQAIKDLDGGGKV